MAINNFFDKPIITPLMQSQSLMRRVEQYFSDPMGYQVQELQRMQAHLADCVWGDQMRREREERERLWLKTEKKPWEL